MKSVVWSVVTVLFYTAISLQYLYAQASVVAGSVATSKSNYTVGQGKNRLLVVAVSGESLGIGTITNISWGGQNLTQVRTQAVSGIMRTDLWYLNEAGISAARGGCSFNVVVTWSVAPLLEAVAIMTLQNVDQTSPVVNFNSGTNADGTLVNTGNIAVGVNDLLVYASSSNNDRAHAQPAAYTEQSEQIVGGIGGLTLATATRPITVASTENPTATWSVLNSALISVGAGFRGVTAIGLQTFYSRNATLGGNWDSPGSWTLNSDGSGGPLATGVWPRRTDHVVIRPGHTITVDATDDNKQCGVSPDGLALPNVGPFVSSNLAMFYQTGDITVGGILNVLGIEMMVRGYTHVLTGGTFTLGSNLVNVGYLEVEAGSVFSTLDDLILTGNSVSLINTNSTSTDDLVIDHNNATLCGIGTATLQNGAGSQVTFSNSSTINQVCSTFTINCIGIGCALSFPVVGATFSTSGNAGPGGIGNSSELSLWLLAGAGTSSTVNGTAISSWNDQSGNVNHATQATLAQRPLYQTSVLNGQPTLLFDNAAGPNNDEMLIADNDNLDNTNGLTIYGVTRPLNLNGDARTIISKRTSVGTEQAYSVFYFTGNNLYTDLDGNGNRFATPATFANNNNYIHTVWYNGQLAAGQRARAYTNGTLEITTTESSATIPNYASPVTIGSINLTDGRPFGGHIAEVVVYRRTLNEAQRIIVDNYLSAKYNINIVNDVYTMDNPANGNYDFQVAGIGQATDGSHHLDAKGRGIVRMWNPNDLINNEYLIWGHDNGALAGTTTDVDGALIRQRIVRIWRVSEVGDVGTTSISFDISGFAGAAQGANLRLLVDRNGNGFFDNDVTPIGAGYLSSNVITFTGVNLQNGDRFTLGNTDIATPLPIELLSFTARVVQNEVVLTWATASETNNHYFTVQRSHNAESWEEIKQLEGAGTSTIRNDYEFTDGLPHQGVSYYRIRQTDYDGTSTTSAIRRVELSQVYQLKAYPNPASDQLLVITGFELQPQQIQLLNTLGQPVSINVVRSGAEAFIDIQDLPAGVYILRVRAGYWQQTVRILIRH
ncbi:MAG: T9SS type A sorting domain-containing protein [Cytophagales bacterium]|nr:T9SS type A sorting domain-containing protein [Cytophagales bacterium]